MACDQAIYRAVCLGVSLRSYLYAALTSYRSTYRWTPTAHCALPDGRTLLRIYTPDRGITLQLPVGLRRQLDRATGAPMPPTQRLSANAVATAAGLDSNWVYKAEQNGVLPEEHFVSDIIVIKVYRLISQFIWPDKPAQRSKKQDLDTWQLSALHAARDAVTDEKTTSETTLWITQTGVRVAHTREDRAALESPSPDGQEPSFLDDQVALRLPIGRWIDELPAILARLKKREPRRKGSSRTATPSSRSRRH